MRSSLFIVIFSLLWPLDLAKSTKRHWGVPAIGKCKLENIRGGASKEAKEKKENESTAELPSTTTDTAAYHFSLYQPGDGSEEDPDHIPIRFLDMHKGNREAAKTSLKHTLQWRKEHDVDTMLARPYPYFDICKAITLHSFLGRDASGHIVFYKRPAVDSGEHLKLAHRNNRNNDDMLMHYVYVLEYCWNILDPPTAGESPRVMTSVVDLTGLDFSILRHTELIGFIQKFLTMMSHHYPQRSYKTLILNAPSWFGLLYKMISPMLRESTKAKVQILSQGKHQVEVLREVLGEDCLKYLPPELLETDKKKHKQLMKANLHKPLPTTPMEQEFRAFCCARLRDGKEEMKPITR